MPTARQSSGVLRHPLTRLGALLAAAALLGACGVMADRPDEFGTRSPPPARAGSAAAFGAPDRCVPEGQSCAAPNAVCCPGTSCAGIGSAVCILAY